MADGTTRRVAQFQVVEDPGAATPRSGRVFRCQVHIYPEADRFLVVAAELPGVAATGTTEAAALESIVRVFQAVLPRHLADGGKIPWQVGPLDPLPGGSTKVVFPHVSNPLT